MKRICISFALILIIVLSAYLMANSAPNPKYLRIHIRANSNGIYDQQIKYLVKDLVVTYLTPKISKCQNYSQALNIINSELSAVNGLIDGFLYENGYNYRSKIALKKEEFPTRVYDDLTLLAGVYDALIIELGMGLGDNWWCVVFPPLCFTEDNVTYRSIIWEFLQRFTT